jgi:L-amino acid N-acyltransferase YncA
MFPESAGAKLAVVAFYPLAHLGYYGPMIRDAAIDDAPAIAAIYNPYITKYLTSFEKEAVTSEVMAERIRSVTLRYPWLVCESGGVVVGYAYAAGWKERYAYRYCVETAIYLKDDCGRQGLGTTLYTELLRRLPETGIRVAIGCIALPNHSSVALHEKLGFDKVGHFPAVGYKFGQWIDIGYWQKNLDSDPQSGADVEFPK